MGGGYEVLGQLFPEHVLIRFGEQRLKGMIFDFLPELFRARGLLEYLAGRFRESGLENVERADHRRVTRAVSDLAHVSKPGKRFPPIRHDGEILGRG